MGNQIKNLHLKAFTKEVNMVIKLILGAIIGGGLGLLANLASTKIARGGFT